MSEIEQIQLYRGAVNNTWVRYGLSEALVYYDNTVKPENETGYKAILSQDGKVVSIVSKRYTVIPHAYLKEKAQSYGLTLVRERGDDLSRYWEGDFTIAKLPKSEVKIGDVVETRLKIVNSLDGNRGLNFFMGSFRLVCSNGAVAPDELVSTSVVHRGNIDKLDGIITQVIAQAESAGHELLEFYRQLAERQITPEIANELLNTLPSKVFKSIELTRKTKQNPERQINVTNPNATLWDINLTKKSAR